MRRRFLSLIAVLVMLDCKLKPKEEAKAAPYLPLLAQISASPKTQKPTSIKEEKAATVYAFADPPGMGISKIDLLVSKERPNAWRMSFASSTKIVLPIFDPTQSRGRGSPPTDWFDIAAGPLKGQVVYLPGYIAGQSVMAAEIFSPAYFLTDNFAFRDRQMMEWACESGAANVPSPMATSEFITACKAAVSAKLSRPDTADFHYLGIATQVLIAKDCMHAWKSDVTSENALNAKQKHDFSCVQTKKGVEANL